VTSQPRPGKLGEAAVDRSGAMRYATADRLNEHRGWLQPNTIRPVSIIMWLRQVRGPQHSDGAWEGRSTAHLP
jgi:hypothetical protein